MAINWLNVKSAVVYIHVFNLGFDIVTSVADVASYVNSMNGNRSEIVMSTGDQRPENMIPGTIADMNRKSSEMENKV
jgi:hypothetical protein